MTSGTRPNLLAVVSGAILIVSAMADAGTLTVGPSKTYQTITTAYNAAVAGDTIEIDAGTYLNDHRVVFRREQDGGVDGSVALTF